MTATTKQNEALKTLFAANVSQVAHDPDVSGDVTKYPITIVARTGGIAEHPYWGKCVHDFDGMKPIDGTIPLDWVHTSEVVGFADKVEVRNGELIADGVLVAVASNPTECARDIALKGRAGIPYQASIKMGDDFSTEIVPKNKSITVNGSQFTGPLTVFRKWSVRGIALCPYGSDSSTETLFSAARQSAATQFTTLNESETQQMPDEQTTTESTPTLEERMAALETALSSLSTKYQQFADSMKPHESTSPETDCATGQQFLTEFGDRGGVWFAQGKTLDEARSLFASELQTQLNAANERAAAAENALAEATAKLQFNRGHQKPTKFDPPTKEDKPQPEKTQFAHLSPGIAKLAASIRLPQPSSN